MNHLKISDQRFGELLPFVENKNITDINWNGEALWIDDLEKGRYKSDVILSPEFIQTFSNTIANSVSETFNKYHPILEAESEDLRISIIHEDVAITGRTISIRATPPTVRMSADGELEEFLSCAVKSGFRIVIAGLPGAGKTETLKYLTNFIPENERVITVEDSLEIRYRDINPGKDCVSLKVMDTFDYVDALKAVLRQRPEWVLLSEARSIEIKYLLESFSAGTKCITTLHTDSAQKIPSRIYNMHPPGEDEDKVINQVYEYIDLGILVNRYMPDNAPIERKISEIVIFDYSNNKNQMIHLYRDGVFLTKELPLNLLQKIEKVNLVNPLKKGNKKNESGKKEEKNKSI